MNEFRIDEERKIPIHTADPALEAAQIESLTRARMNRDSSAARGAVERLGNAARGPENLMPYILEAVEACASIGEISGALRAIHGEYREALTV